MSCRTIIDYNTDIISLSNKHKCVTNSLIKKPVCNTYNNNDNNDKNIKGTTLIKMPDADIGLLSKYGYSLHYPYDVRINALKKANKKEDNLKILRHVNALRTLQKSNEKYYNKLNRDLKWLQKHYNYKQN